MVGAAWAAWMQVNGIVDRVADFVGGPQFSYISTSFEPGGGIIEFDCNDNGILDSIDIAEGTSQDENEDGIPDECQATPTPTSCVDR